MKQQQGFTIVMAVFLVVVLGLLGGYMVRLSGVQHATAASSLQGARAYQAAKAGLGWAIAKISAGATCTDINTQAAFALPGISGFTVKPGCSVLDYLEGGQTVHVYNLNARSEFADFTSSDYVSRKLEVSIVQ
ncbi:MAG: hypothetical protein ABL925_17500 [Methylococcales bacterium]